MNRFGFLLGRKCEGPALEPDHFRLKDLQDLARQHGIAYSGIRKDDLCAKLREYYSRLDETSSSATSSTSISTSSTSMAPVPRAPPTSVPAVPPLRSTLPMPAKTGLRSPKKPPMPLKPESPEKPAAPAAPAAPTAPTAPAAPAAPARAGSPKKPQSPKNKEVNSFFSDTNPQGFIRKVEFRSIKPEVPLLIFNLERKVGVFIEPSLDGTPERLERAGRKWRLDVQQLLPDESVERYSVDGEEEIKEWLGILAISDPYYEGLARDLERVFKIRRNTSYVPTEDHWSEELNLSPISPTQFIGIDKAGFIHKASVIFHGTAVGGHYTTVFECDEKWYLYDDMKSSVTLIADDHEQLLAIHPDILTNGILHFYTNAAYETESVFQPCDRLGPEYYKNSCYMDSTLMALFASSNSFVMQHLLEKPLITDVDSRGKVNCDRSVKEKIRLELQRILEYLSGNSTKSRKFCVDLRLLFKQCRYPTYEHFGSSLQQSASEFLIYLFKIFGIENHGMVRYTWGTMDVDANADSLIEDESAAMVPPDRAQFTQTSVSDVSFNFIYEVSPFKLDKFSGESTNDILGGLDDIILL